MFSLFRRKRPPSVAHRFVALAVAHGIREQEIPRLFPGIGYADLDDPRRMLAAITPALVDSAAELFGVRREFLEGLDELAYLPFGSGRVPARESTRRLVDAVAQAANSHPSNGGWVRGPLAVLTNAAALDRHGPQKQWLVPVIVEPTGAELDGPVYRCRVFGGYFDWLDEDQRVGLKSLVWLVWHRLHKVVPLYQAEESTLVDVLSGEVIPSVVLVRPVITNPSLEDYVSAPGSSSVAKDSHELPQVLAFLESSDLKAYWDAAFMQDAPSVATAVTESAEPLTVRTQEPRPAKARNGKRDAAEAAKEALRTAAQGIWATNQTATITSVVKVLKAMPHLRGAAGSDSAIHKAISSVAPAGANKPGRRPKKST